MFWRKFWVRKEEWLSILISNECSESLHVNWAEILEGYKAIAVPSEEDKKSKRSLYAQLEAVADMKFTYVATCQNYGNQKRQGDRRATDILNLMVKYVFHPSEYILSTWNLLALALLQFWISFFFLFSNPSLRVAYIDEVEEREGSKIQKVYYSVLVKAVDNLDQVIIFYFNTESITIVNIIIKSWYFSLVFSLKEIYRIKLPGSAKIGEGKPENQNHAIVFTRGEALQTIDMNQVDLCCYFS